MRKSLVILLLLVVCSASFVACSGSPSTSTTPTATAATSTMFGQPSTSFKLTGLVSHPGTFTLADLQAFPKVTVTINAQPLSARLTAHIAPEHANRHMQGSGALDSRGVAAF